jgi:multiple sugar transport system permease protein
MGINVAEREDTEKARKSALPWNTYSWSRLEVLTERALGTILLFAGGVFFLAPFLFMLLTSLKSNDQLFSGGMLALPNPPVWSNYYQAWFESAPFSLFLRNSLFVSSAVVVGTLISCSLVAFSFARLEWKGRDVWFVILLSTMMLPYQVTLIPVFLVFKSLGWLNTLLPLIVPAFFGNAFIIFLFRQFFMTIPMELDEAAIIDGCSHFDIYLRILLPLSKPAMAMGAIFTFMHSWNDFLGPLIYLNRQETFTLALGLVSFRQEYTVQWSLLMAASLLTMLPNILLFFLAQSWFIQGITLTGVKG